MFCCFPSFKLLLLLIYLIQFLFDLHINSAASYEQYKKIVVYINSAKNFHLQNRQISFCKWTFSNKL